MRGSGDPTLGSSMMQMGDMIRDRTTTRVHLDARAC